VTATDTYLAELTDEQRQLLESWLVEFDLSWHADQLAAWLRRLPPRGDGLRRPALVEMVRIDLERRWQRGQRANLEAYVKALPELATPDPLPADLVLAEYEARQRCGLPAELAEFARRFPGQADELRLLITESQEEARSGGVRPTLETAKPRNQDTDGSGSGPAPVPQASSPGENATPQFSTPLPRQLARDAMSPLERFGRYRIVRELGRGAMGNVYLAHDTQLDRLVALKVPRFTAADGPEVRQRFLREARAAATIEHPNVCPVYDVGEIDGTPYLTMAYLQGQPLVQLLEGRAPLPERQAATLIHQLSMALQTAHDRGIIHRDLKPSNILINQRGEPVILDFGLARRLHQDGARLTQCGQPVGTPAYMSPEQVVGAVQEMGPGCDIYALGVILYQLLTGRLPFDGAIADVLGQIVTQQPEPPSKHRPGLDPRLEAVCLKALSKKVADRYATMRDFGAALSDYLHHNLAKPAPTVDPISASATPVAGQGARPRTGWLTRKRLTLAVAAGCCVVALVAIALLWNSGSAGAIRLDLDGPRADVEVQLDGEPIDTAALQEPLHLRPGKHHLLVTGNKIQPVSTSFTIARGDNPPLRVMLAPRVGAAADSNPSPSDNPRRRRDDDDKDRKDDRKERKDDRNDD
jgi:hypothetical protein